VKKLALLVAAATSLAGPALAGCGGDDESDTESAKPEHGTPVIVKGAGDIQPDVERFRRLLGPDNGGGPTGRQRGRREINWDKVPDDLASPNKLPPQFFNAGQAPRARGAVLETPGENVAVSADSENPSGAAPRFGNINRSYSGQFKTFSKERLFSPIGSNVVNLTFNVPGTHTPAAVRGFGAVYTDIDRVENTAFAYFDAKGQPLGKFAAPVSKDGLSFLGVLFPEAVVSRVRIEYGSGKLGPDESQDYDVAVMDDFIYGEPQRASD
jgi:hypothetical protein